MQYSLEQLRNNQSSFQGNVKDLEKLIKKIASTSHAPTSEKHTKRMEPFATDSSILKFVNDQLFLYFHNTNRFGKAQNGLISYDIKDAWYLFTLLIYSDQAERTVVEIIDHLIKDKNPHLSVARRILFFCNKPVYQKQRNQVEAFFAKQNQTTKLYQWFKALKVSPPQTLDWQFTIRLKASPTEGLKSNYSDNLTLTLMGFEPKGDGTSFEIKLQNQERNISADWNDFSPDTDIRFGTQKISISEPPRIETLREFIAELEGIFNLQFDRDYDFHYFTRGFKNKNNIQKWLQKN